MNGLLLRYGLDRRALLGLCGVLAILAWWYFSLPTEPFFGDDGRLIYTAQHGGFLSRFPDSIFQAELLKYRPIASGVLSLLAPLLGANHAAWEAVAKCVNLVASVVFFLCCWFVSRRNLYVCLGLTLLFGISRFEYHGLTQAWGIFEGVPLVLTLLLLLEAILYFGEERSGSLVRAVVWYGLMIYSYERFLPMIVPLLVFLWLANRSRFLIWISLGLVASNALIKAVFFHFNFLQGTGGQGLHFQPSTIVGFLATGLANLVGYPVTPQYLSGMPFDQLTALERLPSVIFSIVVVAAFALALALKRPAWPRVLSDLAVPIVLGSAFAALLLVASVTFRQEYRFLYSPYAVLLIGLAFALGQLGAYRALTLALTTGIALMGFLIDAPYHDYVVNTWFGSTSQWLAEAKTLLIDQRVQHARHVVVITHGVEAVQSFALSPWFFTTYDPYRDYDVSFIPDPPGSRSQGGARFRADASYYDVSTLHFIDVTADVRLHMRSTGTPPRIDLLKYPCSQSSAEDADSAAPAVSQEGWPAQYDSVPTLTLRPGAACRFERVRIQRGDRLSLFAAVPQRSVEWEGTQIVDSGLLTVSVDDGRGRTRVIDDAIALEPVANKVRWSYFSADLSAFAGREVTIEITAASPAGVEYPGAIAVGLPWIVRE